MSCEPTGGSKLPEPVTHHVFINPYGNKIPSIVDLKGMPHKLGNNLTGPGPGPYRFAHAGFLLLNNFFQELFINKRAFFIRSAHGDYFFLRLTIKLFVIFLGFLVFPPFEGFPHGEHG